MGVADFTDSLSAGITSRVPGVSFFFGSGFIGSNDKGNRVVFVPIRHEYLPAVAQRGVERIIRTKWVHIEAHIWGVPTLADGTILRPGTALPPDGFRSAVRVEMIETALICALHDAVGGGPNLQLGEGQWEDVKGEGQSQYGLSFVLPFAVKANIIYAALALAPVPASTEVLTPLPISG